MSNTTNVVLVGLPEVLRRLRYLSYNIEDDRVMREVGLFLVARIQMRTAEGKDVDGNRFEPYSPSYKLFREKSGRTGNKVNLFYTGSMMSSMNIDATKNTVTLFFQNTTDRSGSRNPLKAFFLNKKRRFFAISAEDRVRAFRIIDKHITSLIRSRRRR